jgi:hypothetical protein
MPDATERTLYTLGYRAGWTPAEALAAAERHGALLVDIRFQPTSRDPRWRQPHLRKVLGDRYLHLQGLGNANFRGGGPIRLADPEPAAAALAELYATGGQAILMCMCGSPAGCHRTPAAAYVADRLGGIAVRHWLSPADASPGGPSAQLSIFGD